MVTRQELYDRIRSASKTEVILEEMIRLGFWPRDGLLPNDPVDEIRRRTELERLLRSLTTENTRLQNTEAIRREQRRQRLAESRRKRQETKERRLRERAERAAAWRERKQSEIVYLGEGVSAGLGDTQSDVDRLRRFGLPELHSASELAAAMEISVGELRFLAFHRRTTTVTHYRRFAVRKKAGGLRHISAPMPRLKRTQHWILHNILQQVPLHQAAHGFRTGRSIVTNAAPHVGSDIVINVDVEDFFPTVTYRRIKGMFRSLGYGESVATVLALLTSEPDRAEVELDGRTYFVARGERRLPQGAPTSPAITNILCRGLDARLWHAAERFGFRYTRYADDMTFSGPAESAKNVRGILARVRHVVLAEGFCIHPKKTRVLRSGSRREVTGLTVHERVNVSRKELRRFRATLFQIERDGPAGKRWGDSDDVIASIEGFANFVAMVDAERGGQLQRRVEAIIQRHGRGPRRHAQRPRWRPKPPAAEIVTATVVETAHLPAHAGTAPQKPPRDSQPPGKKPWWKFW